MGVNETCSDFTSTQNQPHHIRSRHSTSPPPNGTAVPRLCPWNVWLSEALLAIYLNSSLYRYVSELCCPEFFPSKICFACLFHFLSWCLQALQTCPRITSFAEDLWLEWDPRSWHPGSSQGKQSSSHKTFYWQRRELPAADRWRGHESQRCCLITLKIWWCNDVMQWHAMASSTFVPFCCAMLWLEGGILRILMIVCMHAASADILFFGKTSWPMQIDIWIMVPNHLHCTVVDTSFSANWMTSRHLKATVFVKSMEEIEWPQFSKLWLLRHQNCLRVFLSSFCWVLPAAWPRAAAPEAKHRCIWQPSKATIPWSSGSSRRRRPWMHRTKRAVAPEFAGEISWGVGSLWSEWRSWWFKCFVDFVYHLWQVSRCTKTFAATFLLFVVITIVSFPRHPLASSK